MKFDRSSFVCIFEFFLQRWFWLRFSSTILNIIEFVSYLSFQNFWRWFYWNRFLSFGFKWSWLWRVMSLSFWILNQRGFLLFVICHNFRFIFNVSVLFFLAFLRRNGRIWFWKLLNMTVYFYICIIFCYSRMSFSWLNVFITTIFVRTFVGTFFRIVFCSIVFIIRCYIDSL